GSCEYGTRHGCWRVLSHLSFPKTQPSLMRKSAQISWAFSASRSTNSRISMLRVMWSTRRGFGWYLSAIVMAPYSGYPILKDGIQFIESFRRGPIRGHLKNNHLSRPNIKAPAGNPGLAKDHYRKTGAKEDSGFQLVPRRWERNWSMHRFCVRAAR